MADPLYAYIIQKYTVKKRERETESGIVKFVCSNTVINQTVTDIHTHRYTQLSSSSLTQKAAKQIIKINAYITGQNNFV